MTPLRRNILIFHQGALGDFVLTWPIALAMARIHPQSRIFYVTHAQKGKLAEKVLGVESADAETGWHSLFGDGTSLGETPAGKLLRGAHSILSFLSSSESPWFENVKRLAPEANVLTIRPNPPPDFAGHVSEFQLEQLRQEPAAHSAAEQILRSVQSRGIGVARPANRFADIVVHPGSGSPTKNWPLERYVDLIARLRERKKAVRVLLGEVERERWPADAVDRLSALAPVRQPTTYVELMAELLSAGAYVGNDSGPSHLAGILGVPTLALFGPTDPAQWKPLGPHVDVLRRDPLDALSVDDVSKHAVALLQ